MSTKRDSILDVLITRMKQINGTGTYVFNLGNRVEFSQERPDVKTYSSFQDYPKMFVWVAGISPEFYFGGVIRETIDVNLISAFNAILTKTQIMDYISDVFTALGDDLKFGGLADYAILEPLVSGQTLEEEKFTEIVNPVQIVYRRHKTIR